MADNSSPSAAQPAREAQLRWDESKMVTGFAKVANIQSTREQVDLFFATNQTWHALNDGDTLSIGLSNRIILSPVAARRRAAALNGVSREYEARFGEILV